MEHTPKFLMAHFDGDYLEHVAFVDTEEEASQLTCLVSPGDHWSPVLIPIATAATAPELLEICERVHLYLVMSDNKRESLLADELEAAINKATA